jgi:cytochrome d ubiquinol oxidase subunit II
MFFIGSALLAVVFGAALANVMRGVPLDSHGYFFEPLWTNFSPSGPNPGVLDWYTILVGLLALVLLTVHGANFIAMKTEGVVNRRARRIARNLWLPLVVLTAGSTIATFSLRTSLFDSFNNRPWGYIFPLLSVGGLAALGYGHLKGWERGAFAASAATILGLMASTAFGLYPNVLPAVTSANSLTVDNASASNYALVVGLVWWLIAMVLVIIYFTITYRLFRGKVRTDEAAGGY